MEFNINDLKSVPNSEDLINKVKNKEMTLGEASIEGARRLGKEQKAVNTLISAFNKNI